MGADSGRGVLAGHMAKALADIRENLKSVHVVLELVDARIPETSRNPHLGRLVGNKARILVLNKADLAAEEATRRWLDDFRRQGMMALAVETKTGHGLNRLLAAARELSGARVAHGQPLRAMVVGIPNVGKSSLLNRLTGQGSARTGARPGITRGKQWVRAGELQILDLPGILPPFLRNRTALARLAITGGIGSEAFPDQEAALALIGLLRRLSPRALEATYGLESELGEPLAVLEAVGRRRGCLLSGGRVDLERAADLLLKDFRAGKLGRITLEEPPADM